MLLFIISTVDINYAQHMKFNGISMGETPTVFINKLKAKGFTPISQSGDVLSGNFCGQSNCIIVVLTNKNVVTATNVLFSKMKTWKDLENYYIYFKSLLTQKYGDPIKCTEEFEGCPEDDSSKLYCVKTNRCIYHSLFMNDVGYISLNIDPFINNKYIVSIFYGDLINMDKNNQFNIEDL